MQTIFNRAIFKLSAAALAVLAPLGQAHAERIFALTDEFTFGVRIQTFDSSAPGTVTSAGVISGIARGDRLVGLDLRPANRQLYSVGTSGRLYVITKNASGADYTATSLGKLSGATLAGSRFGIDFNPTVDRLRLVSETNQNLRINPNTSPPVALVDTPVTLGGSSTFDLLGVAYANSRPGALTTVLYGLDAATDSLVRSTNANAGTYVGTNTAGMAFGPLGVSFSPTSRISFDISGGSGLGYFTLGDTFYGVNLSSGAGTLIGKSGARDIIGLTAAAVPEPATWAMMITGFGMVGGAMRSRATRRPASA